MAHSSTGSAFGCLAALVVASCGGGSPSSPDTGIAGDGPSASDGPAGPAGGATLYIGSGPGIHTLRADLTSGRLTHVDRVAAGDDVRYADLDSAGHHLYVQTQLGKAYAVLTFDVQADGTLKKSGEVAFPYPMIEGVSQVLVHPTAPWFLISVSDRLAGLEDHLMPIGAGGQLGMARVMAREFYGFNWDPTGKFFYGLDGVALSQYRFDPAAGTLAPLAPPQSEGSSDHTFLGLEVHPSGKWAYTVEEDALGRFDLDPAMGRLSKPDYYLGPLPAEPVLWTSLATTDRSLYVLAHEPDTERLLVDVFAIDPGTGGLSHRQRQKGEADRALLDTGQQAPVVLGGWLWVGGRGATTVVDGQSVVLGYRIAPADGTLPSAGEPLTLPASTGPVTFILALSR